MNIDQESLKLHYELQGKIEVHPRGGRALPGDR